MITLVTGTRKLWWTRRQALKLSQGFLKAFYLQGSGCRCVSFFPWSRQQRIITSSSFNTRGSERCDMCHSDLPEEKDVKICFHFEICTREADLSLGREREGETEASVVSLERGWAALCRACWIGLLVQLWFYLHFLLRTTAKGSIPQRTRPRQWCAYTSVRQNP